MLVSIFMPVLMGLFSTALTNPQLGCVGNSTSGDPMVLFFETNGSSSIARIRVKNVDFRGSVRLNYRFRVLKSPLLHLTDATGTRNIGVRKISGGRYVVKFRLVGVSKVTGQGVSLNGVVPDARCNFVGEWPLANAVAPDSGLALMDLVREGRAGSITEALDIARTSDLAPEEKEIFFRAYLDWMAESKDDGGIAESTNALFASNVSDAFKLISLRKLSDNSRFGFHATALAAGALAQCRRCSLSEPLLSELLAQTIRHANQDDDLVLATKALAELSVEHRSEGLPSRTATLEFLFSPAGKKALGQAGGLGFLAKALTFYVPSDRLASDSTVLFQRLMKPGVLDAQEIDLFLEGLLRNHADGNLLKPTLQPELQLKLLRWIAANPLSEKSAAERATLQASWVQSEMKVSEFVGDSKGMIRLIAADASAVPAEVVLQWLMKQKDPVPEEGQLIEVILRKLPGYSEQETAFTFEGRPRGILNDLVSFAFSRRSALTGQIVSAVLKDPRTPPSTLTRVLTLTSNSEEISRATATRFLTAIAHHPRVYEMGASGSPVAAIVSLMAEALHNPHPNSAKFDLYVLRKLLQEMISSGRMDSHQCAVARQLMNEVMSI